MGAGAGSGRGDRDNDRGGGGELRGGGASPDRFNYHVPPPTVEGWEGDNVGSPTSGINPWAVSATSQNDAWIVGQPRSHLVMRKGRIHRIHDVGYPQAWHWSGGSWHIVPMAPAGASAEFHAVAATRSEVWAVGSTHPSYRRTRPLAGAVGRGALAGEPPCHGQPWLAARRVGKRAGQRVGGRRGLPAA